MSRIFLLLLLVTISVQSQNNDSYSLEKNEDSIAVDNNQRAIAVTFNMHNTGITESSAIGKATDGRIGFNTGVQVFVYKHFYISGFTGTSYLQVKDRGLVGNYQRSTVTHSYLQIGYEFPVGEKIRLGLSYAPTGIVRYKNLLNSSNGVKQIDRASLTMYGTSISYNLSKSIALFVDYSFRNDKTKIRTSPEFQNDFNKIQYHNISLGIRFYGGGKDLFTGVMGYFK